MITDRTAEPPRFAYRVPNVSGGLVGLSEDDLALSGAG